MSSEAGGHLARHATDGIYFASDGSLTATTDSESKPWIQIDLSSIYNIIGVKVCSRTDEFYGKGKLPKTAAMHIVDHYFKTKFYVDISNFETLSQIS